MLITGFAAGSADANCYFAAPGPGAAAVVVDPGDEVVQTLEYYFAANDLTPAAVLLTHGHARHTASVHDLCLGWEVPVYIHPADRHLLGELELGEPDEVVEIADGDVLELAGVAVAVDHTPGHTEGSVVFRISADTDEGPAEVAFTGDTLLCRGIGTGDRATLLSSIARKLLVLGDDTVVLPGHGTSTTIGAERRFNPLLKDLRAS
ncbi:MBL fold metallo-hydrolase [Mycolicibacterium palauense]|uniref:MBL fold metallo-hydrolase n=1 Tax=Mycolicibacterium palauense TaxID=2034511 RepID=UPI000BFEB00D|nr:MBL fold metallo-hydrolase [Mycolicibacterium palauense]